MPTNDEVGLELSEVNVTEIVGLVDTEGAADDEEEKKEEEIVEEIDTSKLLQLMNSHKMYHQIRVYAYTDGEYKYVENFKQFPLDFTREIISKNGKEIILKNSSFYECIGVPLPASLITEESKSKKSGAVTAAITRKISDALGITEKTDGGLLLEDAILPNLLADPKPKDLPLFYNEKEKEEAKRRFTPDTKIPLPKKREFPSNADYHDFAEKEYDFYLRDLAATEVITPTKSTGGGGFLSFFSR